MATETPPPATKSALEAVLERVELPRVGKRALEMLVVLLGNDDLAPLLKTEGVGQAREELAQLVQRWIEDSEGSRYVTNAGAVLLVVLALAHKLMGTGPGPTQAADAAAPWLLERDRHVLLLHGVASLVEDVHEGLALDEGRRALTHDVRSLLDKVARLDPLALDVSGGRVLLAGRPITFRRKGARPAGVVAEKRILKVSNNEGKFLLLCALGRPPRGVSASVVSHVRAALEASGGRLRLERDLRLTPQPRLTRRAERAAARIRWLGAAQVRSVS